MAHPSIVRIYDAGEEEAIDSNGNLVKTPFIIMELVKGKLLREVIHSGSVEIEKAIKYVTGILSALEVSHRSGVIHRDIKPANVMISENDAVKVMDFGIARAVSDNSATQAATAGIVGTAQYFSPEQARGESVDARTDLYSTGVILYELLAGRPPFKGESAVSVAYQHVSEQAPNPSDFNSQVTPELNAVVMRAMAKDRDERFQSAEEFREHLLAAQSGVVVTKPQPKPVTQIEPVEVDATELLEKPESLPTALLEGFETAPSEQISISSNKLGIGVLWGLGTGVAVILIGLVFWLFSIGANTNTNPTGNGVTVANVADSLYEDALEALTAQDLVVLRVYEQSDTVPAGVVIRQEPAAGTLVLPKTPITVYVSSGATEVVVPNLVGTQEANAVAMIEQAGLTVGSITVTGSPTVAEGVVITSDPVAGSKLPQGSVVNLILSNGKVTVPDVRNLAVTEAISLLTNPAVGYTTSVEIENAASCNGNPGNVVIDQSILPGDAPQKQNIILYVECVN
jgi:serine/threonine-protein kinase